MTTSSTPSPAGENQPRDTVYWAQQVSALKVTKTPKGALNLNVEGRQVIGPLQGFGQMWQKIYWVPLTGTTVTSTEVIKTWKERFPEFWPKGSHFYPSLTGMVPGEVAFIDTLIPGGLPIPVSTGMWVLYADEESFTLMTPQGHPVAAWITFSAYQEQGCPLVQIHILMRADDPIYEAGFRLLGSQGEDRFWQHTLTSLAAFFGVNESIHMQKSLIDPRLQWSQAGNVWQNAAIRTMLYRMISPVIWIRKRIRR